MRRFVLAASALTVLAACQPATTELTEEQKAEIEAAVVEASVAYTEVYHGKDFDGYMSFNSDWAGSPWGGAETLGELRSGVQAEWDRWDLEHENGEMKVMVLGPDAAAVTFTQVQVRIDSAEVRQETAHKLAFVWVREAGRWKLLVAK